LLRWASWQPWPASPQQWAASIPLPASRLWARCRPQKAWFPEASTRAVGQRFPAVSTLRERGTGWPAVEWTPPAPSLRRVWERPPWEVRHLLAAASTAKRRKRTRSGERPGPRHPEVIWTVSWHPPRRRMRPSGRAWRPRNPARRPAPEPVEVQRFPSPKGRPMACLRWFYRRRSFVSSVLFPKMSISDPFSIAESDFINYSTHFSTNKVFTLPRTLFLDV